MTYFVIENNSGLSEAAVAYEDEETARMVFEEWQRGHDSKYVLSEKEHATEQELWRGRVVVSLLD